VTVDEIAVQLNIGIGSAYSMVHDNLQFHKMCARWVPKKVTVEHKHMRLDILPATWLDIMKKVTTFCNELSKVMIPGFTTIKQKSMQWRHPSFPVAKKFEPQPSAGKLVLTIFWNFK
jgi:hypothetical protein